MVVKRRVKLTYPLELLDQPVLYNLIKQYDLVTNIQRASVNMEEGWLVLIIEGEEKVLEEGLAWLSSQGIKIEPME
jgi:ABC-type methionine transport system ATPase subunit